MNSEARLGPWTSSTVTWLGAWAVAIDLVNAVGRDGVLARPSEAFEAHGYQAPATDQDWAEVGELACEHKALFDAVIDHRDAAVDVLNARLRRLDVTPQLERRDDGRQVHVHTLHFHSAAAGFADGWGAGITTALAIALGTDDADRIGRCTAQGCRQLFLDRGRNNQRRFCSLQCQNRAKSAAYRARRVDG